MQNKMDVQEVDGFCENKGFILDKKKRKRKTNDTNPGHFWSVIEDVKLKFNLRTFASRDHHI